MRRLVFLVLLAIFVASDSRAAALSCYSALQFVARQVGISLPDSNQKRLVEPAVARAREVLGELLPEDPTGGVKVSYVACLPGAGCKFSPLWNVLQMDSQPLLKNPEAFGAIYVHELAHSVQARANPKVQRLRVELAGLKSQQLTGWTRVERFRKKVVKSINEGGFWGLYYYFSNAEAKLYDMQIELDEVLNREMEKHGHETDEKRERLNPVVLLQVSTGELFSDLTSCSAYGDGNVIAKSLKVLSGQDHSDRENATAAEIPETPGWVVMEYVDPHEFFTPARRLIWDRYLKGKSPAESRNVLALLDQHAREWPEKALASGIFDPARKREIDRNKANRLFLQSFEARLN